MCRSERNNYAACAQPAMTMANTQQVPVQGCDANVYNSSCGSRRRGAGGSCNYGYVGCRGGRCCVHRGHAAAPVELLISGMTQMMRSHLEVERQERAEKKSIPGVQFVDEKKTEGERDAEVEDVSESESEEQGHGREELPSYQAVMKVK